MKEYKFALSQKKVSVHQILNSPFCLFQVSDPGRLAAVSSELITELAARRSLSGNVADSSLAETLALFLWLTETLENQELQLLSTQVFMGGASIKIS